MGLFRRKPKTDAQIEVRSETIDAGSLPGLGEEILETLKEHGIEPGQPRVIDASQIPGLSQEIMSALDQAGVWEKAFGAMAELNMADQDDPVEQLEKLAELHEKGVLSDYEFAVAKQKLLGENWED